MERAVELPFGLSPELPTGPVGRRVLPSRREVWWTGRVAIGLRYEPRPAPDAPAPTADDAEPYANARPMRIFCTSDVPS